MTALPPKANLAGSGVIQGQFKTALDTVNDYLTGLLGADGTPATARAALGVINDTAPTYAQVIAALGFTPPQSGGTGASGTWPIGVSGNAATASKLNSTGGAGTYNWSGQAGQPTWLWGGNDGTNFYVYNPSNFSVNYAGSAGSVPWTGVSGRPTAVAAFQYSGNVGDGIGGALTLNALVQVANDNTVRIYRNTNCNCDCNC